MIEEIPPLLVFIGAAVASDVFVEQVKIGTTTALVNWLGASAGASIAILALGGCIGGLFFWVDPWWWIIQAPMFGGIVGAVVEFPLLVYRGWRNSRAIGLDIIFIVIAAMVLVALIVVFRMTYKETVLPI